MYCIYRLLLGAHGSGLRSGAGLSEDGVLGGDGVATLGGALEGVGVLTHVGRSLGVTVLAPNAEAGRLGGDDDGAGGAGGGHGGGGETDESSAAGGRGLLLRGAHGHDSLGLLGLGSLSLFGKRRREARGREREREREILSTFGWLVFFSAGTVLLYGVLYSTVCVGKHGASNYA